MSIMERRLTRDKLFILKSDFEDKAYPDERFYCWTCVLMEGLIAVFPELKQKIDIERVSFPRPRDSVANLIGSENQSLPTLILATNAPSGLETGEYNGVRFVKGKDAILSALNQRHGIPIPHP